MKIKQLQLPYTGTIRRITPIIGFDTGIYIHFADKTELEIYQPSIVQPLHSIHEGDTIEILQVRSETKRDDGRIVPSQYSLTLV